jgi:hypothetical protein
MYRLPLPEISDVKGYHGGDKFSFEGKKIVRTFPLFRMGDKKCCPTGANRILTYEYQNREFSLVADPVFSTKKYADPVPISIKSRKASTDPSSLPLSSKSERLENAKDSIQSVEEWKNITADAQTPLQQPVLSTAVRQIPKQSAKSVAAYASPAKGRIVKGISVNNNYIEIQANGAIENYRTLRLSKPWRLIIDIPDAKSSIPVNSVIIRKFGIEKARIGLHEGFLRIVFDSSLLSLPTETITKGENLLRISLGVPENK